MGLLCSFFLNQQSNFWKRLGISATPASPNKSDLRSLVLISFISDCAAPPAPSDPNVKNAADKLASFVAKNGRAFENVTRQKNPGDTLFKYVNSIAFLEHLQFNMFLDSLLCTF